MGASPGHFVFNIFSITCSVHCPFPSQWPGFLSLLEPQPGLKGVNRAGHRWENGLGQLPLCPIPEIKPVTESRLTLLASLQVNKLRDQLLGQRMMTLFQSLQTETFDAYPKNHLAWVRPQASFILKGEEAKSNISWFWSAAGGDMFSSSLKGTLSEPFPTVPPLSGSRMLTVTPATNQQLNGPVSQLRWKEQFPTDLPGCRPSPTEQREEVALGLRLPLHVGVLGVRNGCGVRMLKACVSSAPSHSEWLIQAHNTARVRFPLTSEKVGGAALSWWFEDPWVSEGPPLEPDLSLKGLHSICSCQDVASCF